VAKVDVEAEMSKRIRGPDDRGRSLDVSFDLLCQIFLHMPNLAHVHVDAAPICLTPLFRHYTFWLPPPTALYNCTTRSQHAVYQSIFEAIRRSHVQLRSLRIIGCRGSTIGPSAGIDRCRNTSLVGWNCQDHYLPLPRSYPPLAPTPLVLSSVLLDKPSLHNEIELAASFVGFLGQTRKLKHLHVALADALTHYPVSNYPV
jgi:hypothetical protein